MASAEALAPKNTDEPFLGQVVGIEIEIETEENEDLLH
jgi:hypothetical protein